MTEPNYHHAPWQQVPPAPVPQGEAVMLLVYPDGQRRYVKRASRGRRIAAVLIDFALLGIPLFLISLLLFFSKFRDFVNVMEQADPSGEVFFTLLLPLLGSLLGYFLLIFVAKLLYITMVPVLSDGRSFGKMILGLRSVRMDGHFLSKGRIVLRQLVGLHLLSSVTGGITDLVSLVMILTTDYGQGIHDYLADSVVIDERQTR